MVTVEELISDLNGFPPDCPVLMQTAKGLFDIGALMKSNVLLEEGMQSIIVLASDELPEEFFRDLASSGR